VCVCKVLSAREKACVAVCKRTSAHVRMCV